MKDKLVKYGHRKVYYRIKIAIFAFFAFFGVAGALATPIAISFGVATSPTKADEVVEVVEVEESSEESLEPSLSEE